MKKSTSDAQEEKQTLLKSEERKFPQLFRWKIATIVIIVLVAGFAIANIIMAVHLSNHQPRKINYTFVSDVINQLAATASDTPLSSLVNILTGFSVSYSDLWYQHAQILKSWSSTTDPALNINDMASTFESNTNQLLIVMGFSDVNNKYMSASYTHISFKVPKDDYSSYLSKQNNSYYTFQIEDRQSVILGVASPNYLKMDGSTYNLLNCKILRLTSSNLYILGSIGIDFATSQINIGSLFGNQTWDCFEGISSQQNFINSLNIILSTSQTVTYDLKWLKIFHLST